MQIYMRVIFFIEKNSDKKKTKKIIGDCSHFNKLSK